MDFRHSTKSEEPKSPHNSKVNDKTCAVHKQYSAVTSSPGVPSLLHNFPLSNLRWNRSMAASNAQRIRRQAEKSQTVSPAEEATIDGFTGIRGRTYDVVAKTKAGNRNAVPRRGSTSPGANNDDEEATPKVWNLRPRKSGRSIVAVAREIKSHNSSRPLGRTRHRTGVDAKMAAETREKMRFSLSLTKEEIEEDFLLMSGAKPSRRPTRRNKHVQKQINNIYPGSWLEAPLPEMYKTPNIY